MEGPYKQNSNPETSQNTDKFDYKKFNFFIERIILWLKFIHKLKAEKKDFKLWQRRYLIKNFYKSKEKYNLIKRGGN